MEHKKITAVIPIRKGSQRVPNKNIKPFGNTTLLQNKIDILLKVDDIDEIIVNTDSEEAIKIVETLYNGTKVSYHRREEYYASSQCSGSEFFKHLGETTDTDIFIYAPCTSPFVSVDTIKNIITMYKTYDCDCVTTVSDVKEFLWLDNKPMNYDTSKAPNSQDLPNIKALNFGCTIIDKNTLISNRNIIGNSPMFITTNEIESIDIDTPLDFEFAEFVYNRLSNLQ